MYSSSLVDILASYIPITAETTKPSTVVCVRRALGAWALGTVYNFARLCITRSFAIPLAALLYFFIIVYYKTLSMPQALSRTYASLDLGLDMGLNESSGPTNSLTRTFQPGQFSTSTPLRLLTRSLPNSGAQRCTQLTVIQNSSAEPVKPSPPPESRSVSTHTHGSRPPTIFAPRPSSPVILCSKPKQDLYRQVLISYLKKTAKGRAFYRGTRKLALTTVKSRTELKWMMATHMPKKISILPAKQSALVCCVSANANTKPN
jgi:hypothetical protein